MSAAIACQTPRCDGDMTEQEAIDSLREHGVALCSTCREQQVFAETVDRAVDDALERKAGL